jgi:lipid-binding SYLF domain-containing protein
MRSSIAFILFLGLGSTMAYADTAAERLAESATIMKEILDAPDKGIPDDLLRKAHCVVVVPGMKKAGFVVGGKYGRGFLVCRNNGGEWGAPAALRIEGGSVGFQIGASETDVIMLVMDPRSKRGILDSKFTLGGDADVAAGPVGRSSSAQTDATMNAKILSYSRSRGAFAGVALTGATLRQDLDENGEMYGKKLTTKEIVNGEVKPPAAAADLRALLSKYRRQAG